MVERVIWEGGKGKVRAVATRHDGGTYGIHMSDATYGVCLSAPTLKGAFTLALQGMLRYWNSERGR
jgi:hypothetical protein